MVSNLSALQHFKSENGIFLFDHDLEEIVRMISHLIRENKQIRETSIMREFAKQYSWEQIAKLVQEIYN